MDWNRFCKVVAKDFRNMWPMFGTTMIILAALPFAVWLMMYVFGGGDDSAVSNTTTPANANTIVTLQGNTQVLGNVYGGGNRGLVSGSTTVNIQE